MQKMLVVIIVLVASTSISAATLHLTDFIADNARSYFNGFEGTSGETQITDNIRVHSANGDISSYNITGYEGANTWYHNGGDYGYAIITLVDGANIGNIGMHVANGWSSASIYYNYELVYQSNVVASGSVQTNYNGYHYLGLEGNGTLFDEFRISATNGSSAGVTSGTYQALALDSIEVQLTGEVPELNNMFLLSVALVLLIGKLKSIK